MVTGFVSALDIFLTQTLSFILHANPIVRFLFADRTKRNYDGASSNMGNWTFTIGFVYGLLANKPSGNNDSSLQKGMRDS